MARFGSPYSSGYGSYNNMVEYLYFDRSRLANRQKYYIYFRARAGWGNAYFGIYLNNILYKNIFVPEGAEISTSIPAIPFTTEVAVQLIRLGQYGDPGYNIARVARLSEVNNSQKVHAWWTWKAIAIGADGESQLTSNWVITGATLHNSVRIVGQKYWSGITFDLIYATSVKAFPIAIGSYAMGGAAFGGSVSGGSNASAKVTINFYYRNQLISSGSGLIGTTITFSPVSNLPIGITGVSGSVFISSSLAASILGATAYLKWPVKMNILRGTANPPTVVVDTVKFDPANDHPQWTESTNLAANTYYYQLQAVSDDLIAGGTPTATFTAVINAPPLAPSNLSYASGSAGAGITMSFTASGTAGATYNAYLGTPTVQMNTADTPVATAIAGSTSIIIPSGNLVGYPGRFTVLVRAVSGGVEEQNTDMVVFSLDAAGNYLTYAPNTPTILPYSVTFSGRQVTVRVTYPQADDLSAGPDLLQLFSRNPGGSYNLAAPIQTGAPAVTFKGIMSATLVYTFPSDQIVYLVACAHTAAGVQGPQSPELGPYNPSTATIAPAPDDFTLNVARG